MLVESIQGEGGIYEAEDSFLCKLSQICSEKNVLLLLDEVQAGIGRTGEFLGFQKSEFNQTQWLWLRDWEVDFPLEPSGLVKNTPIPLDPVVTEPPLEDLPLPAPQPMPCSTYSKRESHLRCPSKRRTSQI